MITDEIRNSESSDPTALTTQSIYREIQNLERFLTVKIEAVESEVKLFRDDQVRVPTELDKRTGQLQSLIVEKFAGVELRFDGINKLFIERDIRVNKMEEAHKQNTTVEIEKIYETFKMIENAIELRFQGVNTQFDEREIRLRDGAIASQKAIDAALQSQKESSSDQSKALILSIDKSDEGTQKQIEQQRIVLEQVQKTLSDKISDVADRLNRWEGTGAGKNSISAPLWAIVSSVVTAMIIVAMMSVINKPQDLEKYISRLDSIEQLITRHEANKITN